MGFLSSTQSICRYHIEGTIDDPVTDQIRTALVRHAMPTLENEYEELSAGWTPFENPYQPDFEKYPFQFGTYFVFSLRIDKKSIPAKLIEKHMALETARKLESSGRDFISKNEKTEIKEQVMDLLLQKIPSIPSIYEILWHYEEKILYFFTTQKAANEIFETLFFKTFKLKPIRMFPYTIIETGSRYSDTQKDRILSLTPMKYKR